MGYDCKQKQFGYARIGLAYVDGQGRHQKLCDVHMFGGADHLEMNASYTAPGQSMSSLRASKAHRDKAARQMFFEVSEVSDDNDLSKGGGALFYSATKPGEIDCWLKGPIKFQRRGYGSLVARLHGWVKPHWSAKSQQEIRKGNWTVEIRGRRHFQPCTMFQTGLMPERWISADQLRSSTKGLDKIDPADGAKSFLWIVEEVKSLQAECDYMRAHAKP